MRRLMTTFLTRSPSRFRVLEWLKYEWIRYADPKLFEGDIWSEDKNDDWMRTGGMRPDGDWQRQITQYWDRANALGLDSLAGRQAMLKSVTTLIDACAAMIRVYGDPPIAGYPSGEVHPGRIRSQTEGEQ